MSDGLIVKTVQLSFHEAYAQYLDEAELRRIIATALFDADIPAERVVFLGVATPFPDGLTAYARAIQAEAEAGLARDDLPPDTVPGTAPHPTPRRPTDE